MSALTRLKRSSPRHRGRRTKHLFYWMAHSHNLAKGSPQHTRLDRSLCVFCGGLLETQCHINTSCAHPPLVEVRKLIRRQVDINICLQTNAGSSRSYTTWRIIYGRTRYLAVIFGMDAGLGMSSMNSYLRPLRPSSRTVTRRQP